jgi:subtilisin family serine protease
MGNSSGMILRMVAAALLAGSAGAQIPDVDLPDTVPSPVGVPGVLTPGGDLVNGITGAADRTARGLASARLARVEGLGRAHRAELDRDPSGELVVRAEVVAIDISEAALRLALDHDFLLKRSQQLPELGVKISVLQTPAGWNARRGLKELRKLDPAGTYDYNHVYLDGGAAASPAPAVPAGPDGARGQGRVGLVDGGIDGGHQVFQNVTLHRSGCGGAIVTNAHGTAVAAILATHIAVDEIYAADVYCGAPAGGAVDTVAAALAWLAGEKVGVINVSLVGPRNALLERAVSALVSRGFLIVAAVGNDGPSSPPLYPAAYPGVVGVTAVDAGHRVLVEACRGEQVDFAARGADMKAATQAPDVYAAVRGTSFAAPIVAALLVEDLPAPDAAARERALAKWTGAARDLGKRGRDDVYGAGELGVMPGTVAEEANK